MSFDVNFYMIDHRLIALAMLLLLTTSCEIGYRLGCRGRDSQESFRSLMTGTGGAMLGLLGLLLGFSLSMAISRWDARHDVLVNEANAIGTSWLRAGLLEDPLRGDLRDALRQYTDVRIALGESRGDPAALRAARSNSESLHTSIWSVVERANQPGRSNAVLSSMINAANELIDIHEVRLASIANYLPAPLFLVLLTVGAVALGFLAWAYGAANQGGRTAIVMLGLLIGVVLLLIMDVNRPQRGRINIGFKSLERVLKTMDAPSPQALIEKGMTRIGRTEASLEQVNQPLCNKIRKHLVDHAAGFRIISDCTEKWPLFSRYSPCFRRNKREAGHGSGYLLEGNLIEDLRGLMDKDNKAETKLDGKIHKNTLWENSNRLNKERENEIIFFTYMYGNFIEYPLCGC